MNINVAAFGYFGHFLAREFDELGHLKTEYTNLPPSKAYGVSRSKMRWNWVSMAPIVASKVGLNRLANYLNWPAIEHFDKWVAANLTECDIFHCFSSFGLRAHRVARERFGAMTVVERGSSHIVFQDEIMCDEFKRWGVPYQPIDSRIVEKEMLEYDECDYITVQSSFAEQTFADQGINKKKIIKMPLGVDLKMFRSIPKEDAIFRVLYAGTMSLRKGSMYMLEAIRGLKLKKFEFVFNGHITPEIKGLVRPYSEIIKNVGTRHFDQLYKLYSQASVFVLPTIEDGFAKVVTEAMACGVPVIATTNCGAQDVLTDGIEGYIVPIRDPEAIREKIIFLYENPERQKEMALAARKKAKSLLGLDTHGKRALEKYKNCHERLCFNS